MILLSAEPATRQPSEERANGHCGCPRYRSTATYTGRDTWELNNQHVDSPGQSQQAERISQR
ncbi:hypothetical protein OIV57_33195, partial [Burkholderia pseudomallei]|uniref:hypothetical protein n=1 Tax=Burkholderia pseudomallei TaxID=28450 RepID=UPI0021F74249